MALLSPLPVLQFFNDDGTFLVGGLLYSYEAGTSTPTPTYTTSAQNVENPNPIPLDARGQAVVWLDGSVTYKLVLARPGDSDPPTSPIWTIDNITTGAIPSGLISYWSGAIDTIPAGWFLCDGNNGTPDLRDSFIVGAGNTYAPGATGGSPTQTTTIGATTLSLGQIPSHAHGITDPGHSHGVTDPGHTHVIADGGHNHGVSDPTHTHVVSDPDHNHGITDAGHAHSIDTATPFVLGGPNPQTTINYPSSPGSRTDTATTGITVNNAATGITNNAAATLVTINNATTGVTNDAATTGVSTNSNTTGISTQDSGGDGSHTHSATNTTNLPPYYALALIMKS